MVELGLSLNVLSFETTLARISFLLLGHILESLVNVLPGMLLPDNMLVLQVNDLRHNHLNDP